MQLLLGEWEQKLLIIIVFDLSALEHIHQGQKLNSLVDTGCEFS